MRATSTEVGVIAGRRNGTAAIGGNGDQGAVPSADAFFLNANNPPGHIALGYLVLVRDGAELARVEFADILSGGTTVEARGYVKLVDETSTWVIASMPAFRSVVLAASRGMRTTAS